VVPLPARVPVHLTYFTAFVDEGLVHFREDLYGLDEREGEPLSDLSGDERALRQQEGGRSCTV
jgi:murein L,D-transpeptidase YcbB/YkuD